LMIRSADARPDPFDGEPEAVAAKLKEALEALDKKRETVNVWEGTPQLLEQLPRTPGTAKMSADDVYGVLQDLYEEAAERGRCRRCTTRSSWPPSAFPGTNSTAPLSGKAGPPAW